MYSFVGDETMTSPTGTAQEAIEHAPKPLEPTEAMRDAGAQRLASFGDDSVWPDSWSAPELASMRNIAERVWRSMWLADTSRCALEHPGPTDGERMD